MSIEKQGKRKREQTIVWKLHAHLEKHVLMCICLFMQAYEFHSLINDQEMTMVSKYNHSGNVAKNLVAQLAPPSVSNKDIQDSNTPSPIVIIEFTKQKIKNYSGNASLK